MRAVHASVCACVHEGSPWAVLVPKQQSPMSTTTSLWASCPEVQRVAFLVEKEAQ